MFILYSSTTLGLFGALHKSTLTLTSTWQRHCQVHKLMSTPSMPGANALPLCCCYQCYDTLGNRATAQVDIHRWLWFVMLNTHRIIHSSTVVVRDGFMWRVMSCCTQQISSRQISSCATLFLMVPENSEHKMNYVLWMCHITDLGTFHTNNEVVISIVKFIIILRVLVIVQKTSITKV